ncbi:cytochrome P450 [Xylogone sp. PMI_703]|nr:cytochrome P450 [Xylogone sp. PMI_703]
MLLFPLFGIFVVAYYFYSWYRLRHFRGPWLGQISYLWMAKTQLSQGADTKYLDLGKRYGNQLIRIGPNDLITSDPNIIRRMSGARSQYPRADWYDPMKVDPYVHNIFSEMDTKLHDHLKSQMAGGYAGKENPTLEQDIDETLNGLIALIDSKYLSSDLVHSPVNFGKITQYFTLDSLTKIAYGEAFGFLKHDDDIFDYIKISESLLPWVAFAAAVPPSRYFFDTKWMRILFGPSPTDKGGAGKLMGLAKKVVGERFEAEESKDKMDMLSSWIRHGLTDRRRLESEILFQIIAGSDTTAGAIRVTCLHIVNSARVLQKLRVEIDAAIEAGKVSNPISNSESKNLPYLQAVVKEGLRMQPPSTGLLMKAVPAGGDVIDGCFIPEGTRIAHNMLALQRDTVIYGSDVEVFRPERWIEAGTQKRIEMEKQLDLVFGYGRWGCMGKPVAYLELNKIFFELFRRFDIEVLGPAAPLRRRNHIITLYENMKVRITERSF